MANANCQDACGQAYRASVGQCVKVLEDCLTNARSPQEEEQCKTRFKACMALAKRAYDLCLEECS